MSQVLLKPEQHLTHFSFFKKITMRNILLFFAIFMPLLATAQSFPSDATVLTDVKKYHGKIATAQVKDAWKLEREAGYNFSNMAKRVVSATTVKEGSASKNIVGLAIYTRGSATDKWMFSRYFVTSSETTGLAMLTEEQIRNQLLDLLRSNTTRVLPEANEIAWVYDVTIPNGLEHTTDRSGDLLYTAQIEYEYKFVKSIPFEGGLRRYQNPLEVYVRVVDGAYKVATAVVLNRDLIKETLMSEKAYNALPTLGQKPFDELSGPQGPNVETTAEDKKTIRVPKIKIGGGRN
jgi:hypothetical protein